MILKRIRYDKYDELYKMIDEKTFFKKDKNEILKIVEESSEEIKINNQSIDISLDPNKYENIVKNSTSSAESSIEIAKSLYEDFVFDGKPVPRSIMYEKEVWTYLNLTVFFDTIQNKYIDLKDKKTLKGKIERNYFNEGPNSKIDRTGLRNLWVLSDLLFYNNNYELLEVAWSFYDPFKAIQECVMGRNPNILKAYALAIKKLDCNPKIKNKVYKTVVPKHIRGYACQNCIDSVEEIETMADKIAEQINLIMTI